jgi:hypothetical protein
MRAKAYHLIILFLPLILVSATGMSRDFYRISQDYRSLAMGNTGIASTNNSSALFYNPAAMSNVFSWWFDFPMVQVEYSDDAAALYETVQEGLDLESQDEQFDFMEENIGKNPYVRIDLGFNAFANLNKKGFTVGGNYTYEVIVDLEVRNASAPEIVAYERLDHIRQVGFSYPLGMGEFIIGLTYKTIDRQELAFTYNFIDATNERDFPTLLDDGLKGFGTGYDIGFIYRTATAAHISIGGVWRSEINLGDASDIPAQLDLGLSSRQDGDLFRLILAMDIRDVTRNLGTEDQESGNKSLIRRLHYGAEIGIFPMDKTTSIFSVRGGYNSGYVTYGLELALAHALVLGYTRYTEETGEYAGQKPSARKVFYLSIGF